MEDYLTLGFKSTSINKVKENTEETLSINWSKHSSDYLGGDYYKGSCGGGESFRLLHNHICEDEYIEDEFRDFPLLLEINNTSNSIEIASKLCDTNTPPFFLKRIAIDEKRLSYEYRYVDGEEVLIEKTQLKPLNWWKQKGKH